MKLTLQIKLLPEVGQADALKNTLKECNAACNEISDIVFKQKIFGQYKIHHACYYGIKGRFNLSSQMVVRCISKVTDAYKKDRGVQRTFKPLGGIAYDSRVLSYKPNNVVSIWSVEGRLKIPFVCHNPKYLPYIKGEADLVFKKGKFYLFQTVEVPEEEVKDVEQFIGVDFGITDLAVTSDGKKHSAEWLNNYREKRQKVRSSLQSKGTKGSKRLLKRLSGKEKTTAKIINHTISKSIVRSAKEQSKGIAIEDLTNIRFTSKRRNKKFRTKLGRWNFAQLRAFMTYKALLNGVPLVVVEPAYTSQTCSVCKHIGKRMNKSFHCANCGHNEDADFNASKNIATLAAVVNQPGNSSMYCNLALHRQG